MIPNTNPLHPPFSPFLLLFFSKKERKERKKRKERRSRSSFAALSFLPDFLSEKIPSEKRRKDKNKSLFRRNPTGGHPNLMSCPSPQFPPSHSLRLTEERERESPDKKKEIHKKVFPIDKEYSHSVKSRSERLTRRGG